jgi:glucose/arabinose dehydrogenase
MALDEAGNLLVAASGAGAVYRYAAANNGSIAGSATPPPPLVSGLTQPTSLAFAGGYLYVGETNTVSRYRYDPRGAAGEREVVVRNLPTGGHHTRTVSFGPDGLLYVGIGSSCNICDERDPRRAAVVRYPAEGGEPERFAWGLRNPVGLAFHPISGRLWVTVNERDWQGNEVPPDLVTIVRAGENFGWPDCLPPNARPQSAGASCRGVTPPTVGIQAHSAPLGLAFYTGQSFPEEYGNHIFVAQHGSWNRQPPSPPKLLRIRMQGERPIGAEDFATGWQDADGRRWGRPAGVIVAADGSLIVSDDLAGVLYRISYEG